ncbi:PAS domain-containing transcriptional regulator [Azospirillum brasilense]|uniref:PAS domain-containing transcriptional regulator n=1 Tax=Azospirillum brasilense TaxID=192 RepID=UPI000E68F420|nr:PAS domain-containing transcriptional regulator [Azospirillum brasilense]NUB27365.1 PAS domain-containing protein [Azospirillum brasilense]NUB35002.1 PAS domain-containing protein [Azospirillum brasilense]RIV97660.1 PAS domain-containing protein [Azospirillum brasilense]
MEYTLQHMDVGLVLLDGDRRVVSVNASVARMLGRDRPLLGASLHDLHPPGSRAKVELLLAAAHDPDSPAAASSMMVALPGRTIVVKATALPPGGAAALALMLFEVTGKALHEPVPPPPADVASEPVTPLVKLPITTRQGVVLIDPADAVYVQADGHYTRVHTADGAFFCSLSLSELEARLDGRQFVRAHRRYLVNLRHAQAIDRSDGRAAFVMAAPGSPRVPVSRGRIEQLKKLLAL